jgi:hypothetical protein
MAPFEIARNGSRPEDISARIFDGALVLFRRLASIDRLTERVREIVEDTFETHDPARAEVNLPADDFRRRSIAARKRVADDEAANRSWQQTLAEAGYPPDACYLDRLRLRIVPSRREIHGRVIRPLPAHRDSWASGIAAQINWWLPLYPIAATRTMLVWPDAFCKPVANDSRSWDYVELISGRYKNYPMLPTTATPAEPGFPVVIEPGELLAFSAAHLHASRSDQSGASRFSLDTRTVWEADVRAGRGAPNVDGAGKIAHWDWFAPPGGRNPLPGTVDPGRHSEGASS